jgi:hypothetical protein
VESFEITVRNDRIKRAGARNGCLTPNLGNWHETILRALNHKKIKIKRKTVILQGNFVQNKKT